MFSGTEIELHKEKMWRKLLRDLSALYFEVHPSVLHNCVSWRIENLGAACAKSGCVALVFSSSIV